MRHLAIWLELVGISVVSVGIGLELTLGGEIYLVVITGGSLLIATGGIVWGKFYHKAGR